jgi:IS30 family transposase
MGGKNSVLLTIEERKIIDKYCKLNKKIGFIAEILCRSHSCIKQELRRNGGKESYDFNIAHQAFLDRNEARIRKIQKGLTNNEIKVIQDAISKNLSINMISVLTGITNHRIKRYFKECKIKYMPRNYTSFQERIEALEEQIEIILDIIIKEKNVNKND